MPDERDIEKGLRAWARRRREDAGAPLELHPATRRLLQAEAARLKGGRDHGSIARRLWGSPLRLVLNLSAVAGLVIVAALLMPQSHHAPVAITSGRKVLTENLREEQENPSAGAPLSLAETDKDFRDDTSKAKSNGNAISLGDKLTVIQKETKPSTAMPGAAPSTATFDQELVPNSSPPTETTAQAVASAAAPVAPKMPAAAPAPPAVQRLLWANSPTNPSTRNELAAKKSSAAPVLASFRTEQTGNRLRVIDADGSVYTGVLAAAARGQVSNGAVSPVQSRSFRVTGTNITSRQRVVFTGRLVLGALSQAAVSSTVAGGAVDVSGNTTGAGSGGLGGGGTYYKAPAQQTNTSAGAGTAFQSAAHGMIPPQPQFRIEGTVRIGTNQIPINAVSAAP